MAVHPPSTVMDEPVMFLAKSEHKYTAMAPMSSGAPIFPLGCFSLANTSVASSNEIFLF